LQGDDALVQIANILKSHLQRSADMAARYGGEEFILLLPNTPSEGAKRVADKLMLAVDRLNIEHRGSHTADHVTISIGIATWQPNRQAKPMTPNRLIDQADSAVYQAKAAGRHCIRAFGVE
jgi:diguanylate cyclase (GGDEF)-like protein